MSQKFPYQLFRNMLFNVPAYKTDIPLHELRQTPASSIVGSLHCVFLQCPPIVLVGPDHHQPELLNPDSLNAALQTMNEHIDKKIYSLQSIQLNSDDLSPGLVYLLRALLDMYQRMMFISSDPHNGEKTWMQFVRRIETDSHLKSLVEHHLFDNELLSIRHYKRLLLGFVKERSIHNAVKSLRKHKDIRSGDNSEPQTDSDDNGSSQKPDTNIQPDQATSPGDNRELTSSTPTMRTSIKNDSDDGESKNAAAGILTNPTTSLEDNEALTTCAPPAFASIKKDSDDSWSWNSKYSAADIQPNPWASHEDNEALTRSALPAITSNKGDSADDGNSINPATGIQPNQAASHDENESPKDDFLTGFINMVKASSSVSGDL